MHVISFIKNYLAGQARKPSGWFGRTVATRVFDLENKPMLHFGLQLMDPNGDDRILEIRKAYVADIPYPDDHFDKVFTANTIYFWPDPEENIKEVKRVLRPGGAFYCAMRLKDQMEAKNSIVRDNKDIFLNLYQKEDAIGLFERAGFEDPDLHHRSDESRTYYVLVGRV